MSKSGLKSSALPQGGGATRRTRASRSASQDPAVPQVAARAHARPGSSASWVERGRHGGGQDCTAGARRICGSGVGGARWRGACARRQEVRPVSSESKGQCGPGAYNCTYLSLCTVVYFICIQQFVLFSLYFHMLSVVCLNQLSCRRISHPMYPHSHLSVGAASVRQRLDHHVGQQREQARPHFSTVIWLREAAVHSATVLRSWRAGVQTRRDLPWYRKRINAVEKAAWHKSVEVY